MSFLRLLALVVFTALPLPIFADEEKPKDEKKSESPKPGEKKDEAKPADKEQKPKESKGAVTLGGALVNYVTKTGMMPILKDDGSTRANVFYVYYAAADAGGKRIGETNAASRPITFCFNGGPGSSAVWLHLGGLGPKRVDTALDNRKPDPLAKIVPNANSLLDATDLVFIDPVATGLSRAAKGEKEEQFLGVDEDIESVGEFIRMICTREKRWESPKFLCGESYGGIRGAGLVDYLQSKHGMYFSGVMIVSGLLNFQMLSDGYGNDLPYIATLPALTAVAHFHKKLAPDLQNADLEKAVAESRKFAFGDYTLALFKGNSLTKSEQQKIAAQLARFTGLSEEIALDHNLRIDSGFFRKMLLKKEGKILGGYDARILGEDGSPGNPWPEFDPSAAFVRGAISAAVNAYVRDELGFESDNPYRVMAPVPWSYTKYGNRYVSMEEHLANAIKQNPALRVLMLVGRSDLVVPEETMIYSVNHLPLPENLRANISFVEFAAGHMMYFNPPDAEKFRKDTVEFIKGAAK
jgi:carboxypeptidase C (cathepsin A)